MFRSKKWLQAVRDIEFCVLCGRYGVQAAHRNEGKGVGIKVDDCLTAALCVDCHSRIDNGRDMSREERRAEMVAPLRRRGRLHHDRGASTNDPAATRNHWRGQV